MPKAKKEVISYNETKELINSIPINRDRALASCAYWSGRRIGEIVKLKHPDIIQRLTTDGKPVLMVTFKISKKKKDVFIRTPFPLEDDIAHYFTDWVKYHKKTYRSDKIFNITTARAWQIMKTIDKDINDHWWRHVRATHLGTRMEAMELCAYFGWSDIKMALRYTHSNPDHVLSRMQELDL